MIINNVNLLFKKKCQALPDFGEVPDVCVSLMLMSCLLDDLGSGAGAVAVGGDNDVDSLDGLGALLA